MSISLVVLGHLVKWRHISLGVLGSYGALGVQVFFVLSGYLITSLLLKEYKQTSTISLKDFYIRRAFRIFPAAFVFLAIVTILYWHQMRWYHVAAAVLYLTNMDLTRPWIFGHLWSLSIEEQFYLLWPFVLKKRYKHKTAILACVFFFTPIFWVGLYAFKVHNGLVGSLPADADKLAVGCLRLFSAAVSHESGNPWPPSCFLRRFSFRGFPQSVRRELCSCSSSCILCSIFASPGLCSTSSRHPIEC